MRLKLGRLLHALARACYRGPLPSDEFKPLMQTHCRYCHRVFVMLDRGFMAAMDQGGATHYMDVIAAWYIKNSMAANHGNVEAVLAPLIGTLQSSGVAVQTVPMPMGTPAPFPFKATKGGPFSAN